MRNSGPPRFEEGGGALKEHLAKTKQNWRSQAPRAAYQAPFLRASPIVGSSRGDPPGLKPHTATDRSYCRSGEALGASRGSAGPKNRLSRGGRPPFPWSSG